MSRKPCALALAALVGAAALTACGSSNSLNSTADGSVVTNPDGSTATWTMPPTASPTPEKSDGTFPVLIETNGTPTGFNWAGVTKPSGTGTTEVKVLKEGTGPVVKDTDTVGVNYLGELYQGTAPFDQSYPKPVVFPLDGVVTGFKLGIAGQKVGSRILIKIPPAEGYPNGTPDGSIAPGSTLYFVVDIVTL